MREDLVQELENRAKSMHLSTSKYCLIVLTRWLGSGEILVLSEGKK